jgi:hypothetical protein
VWRSLWTGGQGASGTARVTLRRAAPTLPAKRGLHAAVARGRAGRLSVALTMVSRPHRDSGPKAEARSAEGRAPEDRWRTPSTEQSEEDGVPKRFQVGTSFWSGSDRCSRCDIRLEMQRRRAAIGQAADAKRYVSPPRLLPNLFRIHPANHISSFASSAQHAAASL